MALIPEQMDSYSESPFIHIHFVDTGYIFFLQFQCFMVCIEVLNPFAVNFVQGDRYSSNLIFLHMDIQFGQNHLLKMLSFLQYMFLTSL